MSSAHDLSALSGNVIDSSLVQDHQVELAEACGVGDYVDLDDLSACDYEAECHTQLSTRSHDDSHGAVHERQSCERSILWEGERLSGYGLCTADLSCPSAVGSEHDVWVEHREKPGEVTASRGSEKGFDDFSLVDEIGIGNRGRVAIAMEKKRRCAYK